LSFGTCGFESQWDKVTREPEQLLRELAATMAADTGDQRMR
jgi:hypothetical protein